MLQAPPGERAHLAVHDQRLAVLVQVLRLKRPDSPTRLGSEDPVDLDRIPPSHQPLLQLDYLRPCIALLQHS